MNTLTGAAPLDPPDGRPRILGPNILLQLAPAPAGHSGQPGFTQLHPPPPAASQAPGPAQPEAPVPQPSTLHPPPAFPRCPGETPRACSAFLAFFQLGQRRSLLAVADQLGEKPDTVKCWSSRYRWSDRIQSFNSGLLQQQAEAEAAVRGQQAADWARRLDEYREQEWAAAQKLLTAVVCYLENIGDRAVERMTLGQASRALQITSRLARLALSGAQTPDEPALAPIQTELLAALEKAYGQPATPPGPIAVPVQSQP